MVALQEAAALVDDELDSLSPLPLLSRRACENWCVFQFCWFLRSKVTDPRLAGRHLAYYSTGDQALRSNAIFLLGTLGA